MATVLEFDQAVARAVLSALGSAAVLLTDASQVAGHVRDTGDPVVIIGPSVDTAVACRLTAQISAAHPGSGVIWLRRRVDTSTVLEAVRAGASDVVGESDLPALVAAANRVSQKASAFASATGSSVGQPSRGIVTAIFAPKGGCGKTSIAANLGALIAREQHQRVVIIDLDLESGDVQLLMSLPQGRSISDLTGLADSLDSASLSAALLPHSSGAFVLAAPRRPEEAAAVSPALISRVVDLATTMFDHVIIDCPPYTTEHVLSVLDVADNLALLCVPDAASIKNTAIALDMLRELSFGGRISLMINHAGDKVGITSADISHALGHSIDCEIPSSLDLPKSTNTGHLLTTWQPKHPISMSIRSWAATLTPSSDRGDAEPVSSENTVPVAAQAKRSRLRFRRVATA
ncbi:MAG: P-loop NTPase [Actinomycetes bacterium]